VNLSTTSPLQVIVLHHVADEDVAPFEAALVQSLQGGSSAAGYLDAGDDLGIQLLRFGQVPTQDAPTLLDACCHSLVVALVDTALLGADQASLWKWIGDAWGHCAHTAGRHALLILPMEERQNRRIVGMQPSLANLQMKASHEYGELSLRPTMFALEVLHQSRRILSRVASAEDIGTPSEHLRLFISHAKADGLPLAHALKRQIELIPWLRDFYDAEDLPPGCDWEMELELGVRSSLILMLRTDIYERRHWCQQEVKWADEYAVPAVMIDARVRLDMPASVLPFDRVPTVRIPDGNLVRVLHAALREGLRFALFKRRVEEMRRAGRFASNAKLKVFSFAPSMAALLRACQSLARTTSEGDLPVIIYPDPPFATGLYESADALVKAHLPSGLLTTPQSLAATHATRGAA
jgi:hypothetical protein